MPPSPYAKLRLLLQVEGVSQETEDMIVKMFEDYDALFARTIKRLDELSGKEAA